jgi:hypothetical protein
VSDAEYLRGMAEKSREVIGHTPEGREHADRLERMAQRLARLDRKLARTRRPREQ